MHGFYDPLIILLQNMVNKNLLKESNYNMLLVSNNITEILNQMKDYKAPNVSKWISKDEV
jgi:predicted Rossmann-fold nucleotide-binding protein